MKGRRRRAKKPAGSPSIRASISFPTDIYKSLEEVANQKKVSLAWVVREAVEKYLADKWPLFSKQN